jgi:hypothetical protein
VSVERSKAKYPVGIRIDSDPGETGAGTAQDWHTAGGLYSSVFFKFVFQLVKKYFVGVDAIAIQICSELDRPWV